MFHKAPECCQRHEHLPIGDHTFRVISTHSGFPPSVPLLREGLWRSKWGLTVKLDITGWRPLDLEDLLCPFRGQTVWRSEDSGDFWQVNGWWLPSDEGPGGRAWYLYLEKFSDSVNMLDWVLDGE